MNKFLSPSLVIVTLLATLGGGYWWGTQQAQPTPPQQTAPVAKAERKPLYYRNPMGLPDTSPTPKKDSMGMDYIAVYEDESSNTAGTVNVSPARLQTLGVKTAFVEKHTLDASVRAVGLVEINERASYDIAPRFEGWIEKLFVNAKGDPVKRGQALFTVYSPELLSTQQELLIAERLQQNSRDADQEAQAAAARLTAATRQRLQNWQMNTPDGKLESRITFTSPVNGIVLEKNALQGARFTAGMSIYRIADLSSVWIIADIYEQDLQRIKVGEPASVTIDALQQSFNAKVAYIYPTLNEKTRTTPIRLELANPDGKLRPGMFAHVELSTGGSIQRLTVPKSAIIDSGEEQVVLLALGNGKFQPQPVKLGLRDRHLVEVLAGLKQGDEVVVAANFLIDAESNLKAALANFSEPKQAVKSYTATGTIDSIDVSNNMVSIAHQPIPALEWPAMTMSFELDRPELLKGILPGQQVHFSFAARGEGNFVIVRIQPLNHSGH